eukprot:8101478-Pyramimonas_sp.AAC.1
MGSPVGWYSWDEDGFYEDSDADDSASEQPGPEEHAVASHETCDRGQPASSGATTQAESKAPSACSSERGPPRAELRPVLPGGELGDASFCDDVRQILSGLPDLGQQQHSAPEHQRRHLYGEARVPGGSALFGPQLRLEREGDCSSRVQGAWDPQRQRTRAGQDNAGRLHAFGS